MTTGRKARTDTEPVAGRLGEFLGVERERPLESRAGFTLDADCGAHTRSIYCCRVSTWSDVLSIDPVPSLLSDNISCF